MTARHMMPGEGGRMVDAPEPPARIGVPILGMGHMPMTLTEARELRDWLIANLPEEAFGGAEEPQREA
jgi:hypothetical protein